MLERPKQEGQKFNIFRAYKNEFKASLGYRRPCVKSKRDVPGAIPAQAQEHTKPFAGEIHFLN